MLKRAIPFFALWMLLFSACSGGLVGPTGTPTPTATAVPTDTPVPTSTPSPTSTATPTLTPTATQTPTPRPTSTPRPTVTPSPTETPIPVEKHEGSGSDVVNVQTGGEPAVVCVVGNQASRYFGVKSYDTNNEQIDVLINTTEYYDGCRPLDWLDDEHTARLVVDAAGPWEIRVIPFGTSDDFIQFVASVPGTIEGNGDDVIFIRSEKGDPDIARITGNDASRYFGVIQYGLKGIDILVNTTDPYDGVVLLDPGVMLMEIIAEGQWEITVETK